MYDIAIIGGGPAGYSAALEAVRSHMSAVLFERGDMGGTCLNRGCVPTKYLMHVARKYYEAGTAADDGLAFHSVCLEFAKTQTHMQGVITSLRTGLEKQLCQGGVEIVRGSAALQDGRLIQCQGKSYKAKNVLIATGSAPAEPVVPGPVSSDDILRLDKLPDKLQIIGGGSIAVEFAEIFRMLGSEVTISIRADRILRGWDREIAVGLEQSMKRKGIRIEKNCRFEGFQREEGVMLLSAAGRRAVLPDAGKKLFDTGTDGGVLVDKYGQTKTAGIYAAGDVVSESHQLAHVGMEQGRRAVRHMAGKNVVESFPVIRCIYPGQEVASVGLTEAEAKGKGLETVCAKQGMYANARTLISAGERGFIKVLAEKESGMLAGAHLMCERAGDMAAEFALALQQKLTVKDMLQIVRPHPSYCEAVTDALMALEDKLDGI